MQPFELCQPTQVIFARGAATRAGSFAGVLGSRALLVCGTSSARMNGSLGDVEQSLLAAGVSFETLEGVPPNPAVSLVDAGAAFARAVRADVVVAVGGGSVIDAAKAVATAAVSHLSFRNYLSGIRQADVHVAATLPVIAVPTLPGSGSETNGTSVIVDDLTGRKLSAHSELAAPRVALLDPAYAASGPPTLLAAGCADALCHAVEAALSQHASIASDALARTAIAMLRECGALAVGGDVDAVGKALWASSLAAQALSLAGSVLTHPLAHPLSARSGTHHGAAVAALEPVVVLTLEARWGEPAMQVAAWLGGRPREVADAPRAIAGRLATWNRDVGVTAGAGELGLALDLVPTFVDDALASGSRGFANTPGEALTRDELAVIYEAALEARPHVAPSRRRLATQGALESARL